MSRHAEETGFEKIAALVAGMFMAAIAQADDGQHHDHGPVDLGKLGKVTFAVSCEGAQKDFSRAGQVPAARYSELLEVVKKDAARPELQLVKSFVAKK